MIEVLSSSNPDCGPNFTTGRRICIMTGDRIWTQANNPERTKCCQNCLRIYGFDLEMKRSNTLQGLTLFELFFRWLLLTNNMNVIPNIWNTDETEIIALVNSKKGRSKQIEQTSSAKSGFHYIFLLLRKSPYFLLFWTHFLQCRDFWPDWNQTSVRVN